MVDTRSTETWTFDNVGQVTDFIASHIHTRWFIVSSILLFPKQLHGCNVCLSKETKIYGYLNSYKIYCLKMTYCIFLIEYKLFYKIFMFFEKYGAIWSKSPIAFKNMGFAIYC